MLVKRVVFETFSTEVPEYAIQGMVVKEFYTTGIDPESSELVSEDYYFCRLAGSLASKSMRRPGRVCRIPGPTYMRANSSRTG